MTLRVLVVTNRKRRDVDSLRSRLGGPMRTLRLRTSKMLPASEFLELTECRSEVVLLDSNSVNGQTADVLAWCVQMGVAVVQEKIGQRGKINLTNVEEWMKANKRDVGATVVEFPGKATEPNAVPVEAAVEVVEVNHTGPVVDIVRVPFDGGVIEAVKRDDGIWTVFKPMCETLGVDTQAQWRRIQREPWGKSSTAILAVVAADGKVREMNALRADMLAAWLFGVQTGSIREDLRPKLDKLKNEGAKVLGAYFTPVAAEAAGVDVEAIGAALMQTGKQLREQRDRIAQLEAHMPIAAREAVAPVAAEVAHVESSLRAEIRALEDKLKGIEIGIGNGLHNPPDGEPQPLRTMERLSTKERQELCRLAYLTCQIMAAPFEPRGTDENEARVNWYRTCVWEDVAESLGHRFLFATRDEVSAIAKTIRESAAGVLERTKGKAIPPSYLSNFRAQIRGRKTK